MVARSGAVTSPLGPGQETSVPAHHPSSERYLATQFPSMNRVPKLEFARSLRSLANYCSANCSFTDYGLVDCLDLFKIVFDFKVMFAVLCAFYKKRSVVG